MIDFPLEGVVFDVDGVLFDTERLMHRVWLEVSGEMGWPQVGERYLEFVGQNRTDILEKMRVLFETGFSAEPFLLTCSQRAQDKMETEGVPLKPGVRETLDFLQSRGIPTALATSTSRERTLRRMELAGLSRCFRAIITGDQVERGKPAPDIYLRACEALGTAPDRTVAVEDSRSGVLSASAAGMPTVMIPDMIPPTAELDALLWKRFGSLLDLRDLLMTME